MRLNTELTWERFVLDLELLHVEDPTSLVPLALHLNQILWPQEIQDQSQRTINFMCYELQARCQEQDEEQRLATLIDYFFIEKGFQLCPREEHGWGESDLLLKNALQNRKGAAIAIAPLFLHLASQLDLPIYLVELNHYCILKWVRARRSCFVDLSADGKEISDGRLLDLLNRNCTAGSGGKPGSTDTLEILPSRAVFLRYAEELSNYYRRTNDLNRLLTAYNTRLVIEPSSLELLAERALLCQKMGYIKEGLQDLKRYFSFVDREHSPLELQTAFFQMQTLSEVRHRPENEFLH